MPLVIQGGDELFPSLSVLCVQQHLGAPQLSVRVGETGVNGVEIGDRFIPTNETGQMLINYRGPAYTFPHFSISDILLGKVPKGTFLNKIVIVGATAIGIGDLRSTPFGHVFPGPEVHANVIDNMLAADFIRRPAWSAIFDMMAIVLLGTIVGMGSGILLSWVLISSIDIGLSFNWARVGLIFLTGVLVGVFASLLPARRATRLDMLEAMQAT